MQFLREESGTAVAAITKRLADELAAGKRVLWLVSGGSNIGLETTVMARLCAQQPDRLEGLAILPMDERYGKPGHADSNSQQLREAGFDPGAATWVDVLIHDVSFDQTVDFYNQVAITAIGNASVIIGQFGLGGDAHTAGILPGSPAATADEVTVAGYEWSDYRRMTLTPAALKNTAAAYMLAYGASKRAALERLQSRTETISHLPAMLLYDIPEVYIYNDQIEDKE